MSEVVRVNDPRRAPPDGVELEAKCVVTKFTTSKKKPTQISSQEVAPCRIKASFELGTVGISIPGRAKMVSVRIDEMMAVLMEAAHAATELAEGEGEPDERTQE